MYGYIDNLRRFVVPDVVLYKGEAISNPSVEILAELGYLELVETESSNSDYIPYYIEEDRRAIQCWEEAPAPTWQDKIEAQVTYNSMMLGTLIEEV